MKVKAYNRANSTEVELTEIARAKKLHSVAGASNFNEVHTPFSTLTNVMAYEYRSRYHYEVRIIDRSLFTVKRLYAYSSTKKCDPQVVANELLKKHQ